MADKSLLELVNKWNKKLYWNDDETCIEQGFQAEEFWNEFGIKSWPKFQDVCAYHIPGKWADDVRIFVNQVEKELGGRITFKQIKEKFCTLTVYFDSTDEDAITRMKELIRECIGRLVSKGVHPPKQEMKNG